MFTTTNYTKNVTTSERLVQIDSAITKEAIKGRIIVLMVDTFYHIN